jgi:hypothetical protein
LPRPYIWRFTRFRRFTLPSARPFDHDTLIAARTWKYSLFQIGVAWKEHLGSYTQAIPVVLKLYL